MSDVSGILDDRNAFRAWLAAYPPDSVVGTACTSCLCPIAMHVGYRTGSSCDVSSMSFEVFDDSYVEYEMPQWAEHFVTLVDEQGQRTVTRAEAQSILDIVEAVL